jgi:hypothetical protein
MITALFAQCFTGLIAFYSQTLKENGLGTIVLFLWFVVIFIPVLLLRGRIKHLIGGLNHWGEAQREQMAISVTFYMGTALVISFLGFGLKAYLEWRQTKARGLEKR